MIKTILLLSIFLGPFNSLYAYEDGDLVEFDEETKLPFYSIHTRPLGESFIGEGQGGSVSSSGLNKVIKIIPLEKFKENISEPMITKIMGEFDIGPEFFDSWVTEKDAKLYVAIEMEKLPYGIDTYNDVVNAIGPEEFFKQFFSLCKKMVEHKISNRDITFKNLMLNKNAQLRMIDFGSSRQYDSPAEATRDLLKSPQFIRMIDFFYRLKNPPKEFKQGLEELETLTM